MNQSKLDGMIETSLENLKKIVDVNTVVGEAIKTDAGVTVIPISKVSLGYVSGGTDYASKRSKPDNTPIGNFAGGGGSGATILPLGFLVIYADGQVEFLSAQPKGASGGSTVDSVIGLVEKSPDIVEKFKRIFTKKKDKTEDKSEAEEEAETEAAVYSD